MTHQFLKDVKNSIINYVHGGNPEKQSNDDDSNSDNTKSASE